MSGSRESDGGCLSALSSCFKRRGKPRPDVSESLNQAIPLMSPGTKVNELSASRSADDEIPSFTTPEIESPVSPPADLPAPLSAGIADKPDFIAPTLDEVSVTTDDAATILDLWKEAYEKVDVKTRNWIDSLPPADVKDPATELVELVRSCEKIHDEESFKLKVGDREILWRDYAKRVVSVVTAIGDIAVSFTPAPSTAVWSAVKVLLKANVSEREDLVAIMGCTDIVLCLVRRGKVYEEVYIGNSPRPPYEEDLKKKLVEVYVACLEFLAFVDQEMQHGNLGRFLDALLDPGHGEKRVSAVKALEQELEFAARACEVKAGDEHRKLLESLEVPLKNVDKNVTDVLRKLEKHEREIAMEYVSTIPVGIHHNEKHEKRTEGTCEWLVSHSKFLEWEDSDCNSVLWLQGNIGTGKSFLSSKVVDRYWIHDKTTSQLPSQHDRGFAFFYCNYSDPTRQSVHSILRSYIRQLGEVTGHPESVHEALYNLYRKKEQIQSDITVNDCETALIEMINSYPRTVLVLDALDECREDTRRQLVGLFKRLVEKSNRLLKIFIASRLEADIEKNLGSFQGPRAMIPIHTSDNHGDIEKFVNTEVDNFTGAWEPETKQRVKESLVEKSDGMFRWTYLQWEQLKELRTNSDVKRRLHGKLPKTLTAAYDEIYGQYDPESVERLMLQRAVRWVMCARRPFDSCILLSAMRVESERTDGDKALDKSDLTERILGTVCRHLVVRDPGLGDWKFPHASVAEYFEAKNESWVKDAQAEITIILINCMIDCCSAYSSVWPPSGVFKNDKDFALHFWFMTEREDQDQTLDPRHPLQEYTQQNWLTHIRDLSEKDDRIGDVARALKRFLGEEGPQQSSREYQVFCTHILAHARWDFFGREYTFDMRFHIKPSTNFVFGVVAMGLHRLLPEWWNRDLDLSSSVNGEGSGLLQIATRYGHYDLCEFLINQGCDINGFDEHEKDGPPLWISVDQQNIDIMKMLLKKGANMDCVVKGRTLLCLAAERSPECCAILLEMGLNPNMKCGGESITSCMFGCALSSAAYHGKLVTMKVLVGKRADVNLEVLIDPFGSPLAAAISGGELDCARFLLEKGADANADLRCGDFGSPLIAAAYSGDLDCVRLLLEHKADVNANSEVGLFGSPLAAAASMGMVDCARLLVEHGADVNAYLEFGEYGSILAAAIFSTVPSLDMIKFLVEEGGADLAQLAFTRPRRAERGTEIIRREADGRIYRKVWHLFSYELRTEEMRMAAYLTQELQMEAQVLISLGVPSGDLPPDTMADSDYEELDQHDVESGYC
ncbi:hypothetical protein CORC01_05383 [Colletotrichum orchidophilum]|uniref:Nephrocystin 3-like N-terminal domain-containing protein n=1 Tax=Colletotrichum orchidophilum TaxID=1209926 RepID=A0A1G4BDD5_9PEZI|nr:uncharacterized protein CORC01_05383 [Colletotrichum orchidophilum]OHE99342.1 hypothetical protein CORC01_05383 [Colletotrichum orchidophilum]